MMQREGVPLTQARGETHTVTSAHHAEKRNCASDSAGETLEEDSMAPGNRDRYDDEVTGATTDDDHDGKTSGTKPATTTSVAAVTSPESEPLSAPTPTPASAAPALYFGGIVEPGPHDVLCGRGCPCYNHSGNVAWRRIISDQRLEYFAAKKATKPCISREIVGMIRKRGGRFLKFHPVAKVWFEIGDGLAQDKTSQQMREKLSLKRMKDELTEQERRRRKNRGGAMISMRKKMRGDHVASSLSSQVLPSSPSSSVATSYRSGAQVLHQATSSLLQSEQSFSSSHTFSPTSPQVAQQHNRWKSAQTDTSSATQCDGDAHTPKVHAAAATTTVSECLPQSCIHYPSNNSGGIGGSTMQLPSMPMMQQQHLGGGAIIMDAGSYYSQQYHNQQYHLLPQPHPMLLHPYSLGGYNPHFYPGTITFAAPAIHSASSPLMMQQMGMFVPTAASLPPTAPQHADGAMMMVTGKEPGNKSPTTDDDHDDKEKHGSDQSDDQESSRRRTT